MSSLAAMVQARDEEGSTPLHGAAAEGRSDVAQELLLWGASLLAANSVGLNAADEAERGKHGLTLKMLEEHIQVLMTRRRYTGQGQQAHEARKFEFEQNDIDRILRRLERKEAMEEAGITEGKRRREGVKTEVAEEPRKIDSDEEDSSTPPWFR